MATEVNSYEGQLMKAKQNAFHFTVTSWKDEDGYFYARVVEEKPDPAGDIKGVALDRYGDEVERCWVDVKAAQKVHTPPWEESEKYERDHEIEDEEKEEAEDENESTLLANLRDEKKNVNQMQDLNAMTVAEDLMKLPVTLVTTEPDNEKWSIILEHPVFGELKFYFEKPLTGVSEKYDIVKLLKSYGILNYDPYKLQKKSLFVEYTGDHEGDDKSLKANWALREKEYVRENYDAEEINGIKSDLFDLVEQDLQEESEESSLLGSVVTRIQEFREQ